MNLFDKFAASRLAAAAAALCMLSAMAPASAQVTPTFLGSRTSFDGLLTLVLSSSNPSDATGVNNTYTWTATNNSTTVTLTGVTLGSHWGDWCGGIANCTPPGPKLISAPGCAAQGVDEIPVDANFGIWCTPLAGVSLAPGQSVKGSVTVRPGSGGRPDYTVYSLYNDPVTGVQIISPRAPVITNNNVVAPAASDIQISGAASTGSPLVGSTYTYTYLVKNAGPWGTFGGMIFVDTLPASITYVGSTVGIFGLQVSSLCSVLGQSVMCALPDLQNGDQATIVITVRAADAAQQIVNTAAIHTVPPQVDQNTANNSVTVNVATK
jgi:uncharacterized repeat protein (TIGR01451 family)